MAAPVSVEEKLKKFQLVCESKLRKIELLEKQYEKNEEILRGFEKDYLMHSELAKLNLNLAQAKLDVAMLREKKKKEEERHAVLQEESKQFQEELHEAVDALDRMVIDIEIMKARMQVRAGTLTDYVTSLRENYLMTLEENRTLSAMIHDATKRTQEDQRLEWLQKLISATRIQRSEAERRLQALHAQPHL